MNQVSCIRIQDISTSSTTNQDNEELGYGLSNCPSVHSSFSHVVQVGRLSSHKTIMVATLNQSTLLVLYGYKLYEHHFLHLNGIHAYATRKDHHWSRYYWWMTTCSFHCHGDILSFQYHIAIEPCLGFKTLMFFLFFFFSIFIVDDEMGVTNILHIIFMETPCFKVFFSRLPIEKPQSSFLGVA